MLTEQEIKETKKQIARLEAKLSGDMMKDMDIKSQIHMLNMLLNGTKPTDSHFECVGCGS